MLSDQPINTGAREHRQDIQTVLTPSQMHQLSSHVHQYYMLGCDCSSPDKVEAVSSFINNPCLDPIPRNEKLNIEEPQEYQLLQYELTGGL